MGYRRFISSNSRESYSSIQPVSSNFSGKNIPKKSRLYQKSKAFPVWIYPQTINAVDNKRVILTRYNPKQLDLDRAV
ncbi:MAG: hypothetical protein AB4206_17310 [Xenococcaceae cyanobacterium]